MSILAKYFSKQDLILVKSACSEAEQTTSGELRVSIFSQRDQEDTNKSLNEIALQEFYKLNMQNTRDKTGVLILIILKEKQFFILADQGINEKVGQPVWDNLAEQMALAFKKGEYRQGLLKLIREIGDRLTFHFPIKRDDINELSDEVVIHE